MAIDTQPNDVASQSDVSPHAHANRDAILLGEQGASRRRFTRVGAGATGVLMTLASQPGMATNVCMGPSGYQSYSVTHKFSSRGPAISCGARGPSYWKDPSCSWPNSCPRGTMFYNAFSCNSSRSLPYKAATCGQIMNQQSYDTAQVGVYMMAMYLSILSNKTTVMTISQLRTMWSDFQANGFYAPSGGVKWYALDIVGYLSVNMS